MEPQHPEARTSPTAQHATGGAGSNASGSREWGGGARERERSRRMYAEALKEEGNAKFEARLFREVYSCPYIAIYYISI